jgi:hypothetical protein
MIANTLSIHHVAKVERKEKWYKSGDGQEAPFLCEIFTFWDKEGGFTEVVAFREVDDVGEA